MQYYLYKKCLKLKNVPIWSEGEGQHFSKMSQMSEGGEGATLIETLSQIFSFFFSDASPNRNTSLAVPEALAHRMQRRTACAIRVPHLYKKIEFHPANPGSHFFLYLKDIHKFSEFLDTVYYSEKRF